jgi:pyruvate dehydrogenase E1 component beta subunit
MTSMTFAQAINDALRVAMQLDDRVICYGLGVDDPKGVFGTTLGLQARFGAGRVFDMPTSENAMTGIGIGAALYGLRPVMTHQRLDFALLSLDQIVNNAAKWHFMFGGKRSVPFTIRMIMGRGWGQGPTHSQNLQAWFGHIPGLKVVMPATVQDAKGLLLSAIFDPNPVIFLENRWLHNITGDVPEGDFRAPIGRAQILRSGNALTIAAMSTLTVEALHAATHLAEQGVHCDVIDIRSIRPLDVETIAASVRRTGRLLVLDTGVVTGSISGEIISSIVEQCWDNLQSAPQRLAMPDGPEPTSPALTKDWYIRAEHVVDKVGAMLGQDFAGSALAEQRRHPHDVPGDWFVGPF